MSAPSFIILVQVAMLQLASSQFSGGGGPSAFGYDASSACSKPYSRNARSHERLPCDLRQQSWCTVAGNTYPWHAVRRFVQENQGLMRRMYGDEGHINVLKTELEKNDIESEYEDKYQRLFGDSRSFEYEDEHEYNIQENESESQARGFDSVFPRLREYTRPHFRPTDTTTSTSSTSKESFEGTGVQSSTTQSSLTSQTTEYLEKSPTEFNDTREKSNEKYATTATVTLSKIANVKNSSFNEIPGLLDVVRDNISSSTESPSTAENSLGETTLEPEGTARTPTTAAIDQIVEDTDGKQDLKFVATGEQQQFRPRPEYRPTETKPESSIEGQFFQDVAAKDQQDQPIQKIRGVNACPVKEEVVAPFWANNTRGEVLALLNLPPFEQYVHWEKCLHENRQMFCREGCRCEQQFRLHRLLAYDPNNECRGIFSDWFKFPSCCVCRCYNLPLEFRVTSRSPRTQKQKHNSRSPGNQWK